MRPRCHHVQEVPGSWAFRLRWIPSGRDEDAYDDLLQTAQRPCWETKAEGHPPPGPLAMQSFLSDLDPSHVWSLIRFKQHCYWTTATFRVASTVESAGASTFGLPSFARIARALHVLLPMRPPSLRQPLASGYPCVAPLL